MKDCVGFAAGNCASKVNPQPLSNFAKDAKRKDGVTPRCKSCQKAYREANKEQRRDTIRAWRERNPQKMADYRKNHAEQNTERMRKWREKNRIRKLYGITNEQVSAMRKSQNGKCKICGIHGSKISRGLHVDHCHITGNVRGLLCINCNQALGHFKDNPALLREAAKYLEEQ